MRWVKWIHEIICPWYFVIRQLSSVPWESKTNYNGQKVKIGSDSTQSRSKCSISGQKRPFVYTFMEHYWTGEPLASCDTSPIYYHEVVSFFATYSSGQWEVQIAADRQFAWMMKVIKKGFYYSTTVDDLVHGLYIQMPNKGQRPQL